MNKRNNGSVILIIALLVSVALIIFLAVNSAKKDVEQLQKLKDTEVIQEQNTREMGDAMQGIKNDIEAGYENLDEQIGQ